MLVIDGNNLVYRNYHKLRTLRNGGTFGTLRSLKFLLGTLDFRAVVTWDGPKNPRRMSLHPSYKSHRATKRDPVDRALMVDQTKVCHAVLQLLGVPQVKMGEADDTIYAIVNRWPLDERERFLIVSGDKDFLQLVDDRVSVLIPHKDVVVTPKNFEEVTGVPRERFLDYLILMGDRSDDIPGVPGIGEKTAAKLVTSIGSIHDIKASTGKHGALVREFSDSVRLARSLIDLSRIQDTRDLEVDWGRWDFDTFLTEVDRMEMDSVIEEASRWEEVFSLNFCLWKHRRNSI